MSVAAQKSERIRIQLPVHKDAAPKNPASSIEHRASSIPEAPLFELNAATNHARQALKKKKKGKPFQTYKKGSVEIPIYKCGDGNFMVVVYECGKRKQNRFTKIENAVKFAERKAIAMGNGEILKGQASQSDLAILAEIKEALGPLGITPSIAIAQFVEDEKERRQAGISRSDVHQLIRSAATRANIPAKTIQTVVEEMIIAREADGAYSNTLADYRSRLGRFAKHFNCLLMAVTAKDVNQWLRTLKAERKGKGNKVIETDRLISRRTRNNYRDAIREMYRYAKEAGYLPKDWTVFDDVTRVKNEPITVKIFTPEDGQKLLDAALPNLVPYLAISFFATTRNEELCPDDATLPRLDWAQVNFKTKQICILPEVARKIGVDRYVPMHPNLIAWLTPYRKAKGPVCELANVSNALLRTAKRAGIPWVDNGPRKSSISYRLAMLKNIEQTAYEAGTSPERIRLNYKKTIPKTEARQWFSIYPPDVATNITELPDQSPAAAVAAGGRP